MGKKLIWPLAIAIVLLFGGWLLYHKLARVAPTSPVVSHWPTPSPPVPPGPGGPSGSATGQPVAPESANKKETPPPEPVFALRAGEALEYDANIAKLDSTVAHLKISAVERRGSAGHGTWHFQAFAHTENPYRMVFELDDQFDSYSDSPAMTSVQYEMHLNERGQKVDTVQRMLTSPSDPVPAGESGARVLPGTRDPLGMLAYLRSVDWSHASQVRSPVFDGHKLYDVQAKYVGKSNGIHVAAGTFNTNKIEIRVFDNGQEMKDAHFVLYLTNDATRLPVLMQAVLPVATARVELAKSR